MLRGARRLLLRSSVAERSAKNPHISEQQRELLSKYGKYAKYFETELPPHVKYADKYDQHRQLIAFNWVNKMQPKVATDTYVAPSATLSGNVEVWDRSSIWYNVVIRADSNLVRIGSWTNIQDRTVITEAFQPLNEDHDGSTIVGHWVTVGHGCQLRACTIEDECMVGMNSILCEGSYMEKNSILGASSVLAPGVRVPSGELWAGNPAKFIRKLTHEEIDAIVENAENYYRVALEHAEEFYLPVGTQYLDAEKRGIQTGFNFPIDEPQK